MDKSVGKCILRQIVRRPRVTIVSPYMGHVGERAALLWVWLFVGWLVVEAAQALAPVVMHLPRVP
jgi:hypothetical protein